MAADIVQRLIARQAAHRRRRVQALGDAQQAGVRSEGGLNGGQQMLDMRQFVQSRPARDVQCQAVLSQAMPDAVDHHGVFAVVFLAQQQLLAQTRVVCAVYPAWCGACQGHGVQLITTHGQQAFG